MQLDRRLARLPRHPRPRRGGEERAGAGRYRRARGRRAPRARHRRHSARGCRSRSARGRPRAASVRAPKPASLRGAPSVCVETTQGFRLAGARARSPPVARRSGTGRRSCRCPARRAASPGVAVDPPVLRRERMREAEACRPGRAGRSGRRADGRRGRGRRRPVRARERCPESGRAGSADRRLGRHGAPDRRSRASRTSDRRRRSGRGAPRSSTESRLVGEQIGRPQLERAPPAAKRDRGSRRGRGYRARRRRARAARAGAAAAAPRADARAGRR